MHQNCVRYGFQFLGYLDFPFIDALLLGYISPPFSPFVSGEIQKAEPLGEICLCSVVLGF